MFSPSILANTCFSQSIKPHIDKDNGRSVADSTGLVDIVDSGVTSAATLGHSETAVGSIEADITGTIEMVSFADTDDSVADVDCVPPATDSESLSFEIPFEPRRFISDIPAATGGADSRPICRDNAFQSATVADDCSLAGQSFCIQRHLKNHLSSATIHFFCYKF